MADKTYRIIADSASLYALVSILFDQNRKATVVAITHRSAGMGVCISPHTALHSIGENAKLVVIPPMLLDDFNERLHNIFGIVPSGLRIFKPRMTIDDHPMRHPVWNEARIDKMVSEGSFDSALRQHTTVIKRFANGRDNLRESPLPATVERRTPTRPLLGIRFKAYGGGNP